MRGELHANLKTDSQVVFGIGGSHSFQQNIDSLIDRGNAGGPHGGHTRGGHGCFGSLVEGCSVRLCWALRGDGEEKGAGERPSVLRVESLVFRTELV